MAVDDSLVLVAAGRRQPQVGTVGVGDNRHAIVLGKLLHQHPHGLLHQRQFVRLAHRAGNVQQKYDIARAATVPLDFAAFQSDAEQAVFRLPGTAGHFHIDGKGRPAAGR